MKYKRFFALTELEQVSCSDEHCETKNGSRDVESPVVEGRKAMTAEQFNLTWQRL